MDAEPAEGGFLFRFPLYVIVNKATFSRRTFLSSVEKLRSPERGKFVPLFTEEELANRVIAGLEFADRGLVKLNTRSALRKFCLDCERIGVAHVCFDLDLRPGGQPAARGRFCDVRAVADDISEDET